MSFVLGLWPRECLFESVCPRKGWPWPCPRLFCVLGLEPCVLDSTSGPSYTDEELQTNVDSETVCLRLLIIGLIVPIKLCLLTIAYYELVLFATERRNTESSIQPQVSWGCIHE